MIVAIYMTIYKLTDNDVMCLGSGGCSSINASAYSEIYGIPVGLVGVIGYLAILALHLLENRNDFMRRNALVLLFSISLTGFLFTLYLIYVEVAIVRAVCPFCLTSQIVMSIIFIISVIRMVKQPQH